MAEVIVSDPEMIRRLWRLGHFYNPTVRAIAEITEQDLPRLTRQDYVVMTAMASFQNFMAGDFDRLALEEHGRIGIADGLVGPATERLFTVPRCGMPDYAPPESFGRVVGSGSWPEPCQKAGVTVSVDPSGMPSNAKAAWSEIIDHVIGGWGFIGLKLKVVPLTGPRANIRISFRSLWGSTIGLAEFNSRSCGGSVFCYLDSSFNANKFGIFKLLFHETGHNCNLEHTRSGIMTPSLGPANDFEGWTSSDPSWSTLKRFFGGEPVEPGPDPGPGPGPPPAPGGITIAGELVARDATGKPLGTYIVVPQTNPGP